jgi:hypothetical protein
MNFEKFSFRFKMSMQKRVNLEKKARPPKHSSPHNLVSRELLILLL